MAHGCDFFLSLSLSLIVVVVAFLKSAKRLRISMYLNCSCNCISMYRNTISIDSIYLQRCAIIINYKLLCLCCCCCRCCRCRLVARKEEQKGGCASPKWDSMQIISNAGFGTVSMTHLKIIEMLFTYFVSSCFGLNNFIFVGLFEHTHTQTHIYGEPTTLFINLNKSMSSIFLQQIECVENRKKNQNQIRA